MTIRHEVRFRKLNLQWHAQEEDGPTGFHLIILLKSKISCSSVHTSDNNAFLLGDVDGSSTWSAAFPLIVDTAREDRRARFLGGMAECSLPV